MKKILSLLCCLSILITSLSFAKTDEPLTSDLERIILIAKNKIYVPQEYTEFEYDFSSESAYNKASWRLVWTKPDVYEGITLLIDNDGHIINYYARSEKDGMNKPMFLKEELKPNADKFLEKIAPEIVNKLEYNEAIFNGTYASTYTYSYTRIENGILMPDNTVQVVVNYETGRVVSASINWLYDVEIPDATFNVTKEDAAKKIGENLEMKLSYRTKTEDDKIIAYLVYSPDKNYISVDAKTGEVYLEREEWLDYGADDSLKNEAFGTIESGSNVAGLTEKEIEKIQELSGLISKQDAINAVKNQKELLLDENLTSVNATLSKAYTKQGEETNYIWRVYLSDNRKPDYESGDTYRAYANATVNAKDGKIISFTSSVKRYDEVNDIEVKYNKEEGQKVFENFITSEIPEKFNKTRLTDKYEDYIVKYINDEPVYGGYAYNYTRVNEGIDYTYNVIRGAVDGVTGKIYRFNYTWDDDIEFESLKDVISASEAYEAYINKDGFNLIYEINNKHLYNSKSEYKYEDYEVEKEVRLVYRPDITPNLISPFTKEQLDYNGNVYTKAKVHSYKDIEGHFAERFIRLAADLEIGPEGEYFKPNEYITNEEFYKYLESFMYYSENNLENKDTYLTRAKAINEIVTIAGYRKIAELKGIYKIDFADSSEIKEEDFGYIAIAKGLGIVKADNHNYLKPYDNLTRAEAICMIMNYIAVK